MIDARLKRYFFDRQIVIDRVAKAERRALSKAGAYIRTSAARSMKRRKGYSRPGSPPHSHGQGLLRRFIFFAWEPSRETVVVGPAKISRPGSVPSLMEFGGEVVTRTDRFVGDALGRFAARRRRKIAAGTRLKYAPRPYMRPALEANLHVLPQAFRAEVK